MMGRARAMVKTPLIYPGQRIGLMGGSFNPPHDGHRIVAETAVKPRMTMIAARAASSGRLAKGLSVGAVVMAPG